MSLSEEQFERIVGKADSAIAEQEHRIMLPDGTFTSDRRTETRVPFGQRAKIRPDSPEHSESWTTIMLQDISLSGVGFLSEEAQALDARFVICLQEQSGDYRCVRCVVQRCEPGGFGGTSFAIGARILQVLAQQTELADVPTAPVEQPLADPLEAFAPDASAPETEPAPQQQKRPARSGPLTRALRTLNPKRIVSHFKRDYDDFGTTGSGSKLPEGALSDIAKTIETAPSRYQPQPVRPITNPNGSNAPRRSSIFLHEDQPELIASAPVAAKTPVKELPMSQSAVLEAPATPALPTTREPAKTPVEPNDYFTWAKRDLRNKRYVYMWAGELSISPYLGAPRIMVLIGAVEKGQPELIALQATSLNNPSTWKKLLFNIVRRGLTKPPRLAIADPSLDFWNALAAFSPGSGKQFCWDHQIAHILSLVPRGMQRLAEKELRQISSHPNREDAANAFDLLCQDFQADAPKAAQFMQQNKEAMLTFYSFPPEDRHMLKTCAPTRQLFEANGALTFDESLSMDQTLAALLKLSESTPKPTAVAA